MVRVVPRRTNRPGIVTEGEPNGTFLRDVPPTSNRCRSTHDVPYSLRCVQTADHKGKHKDKENNEWDSDES